MDPYSPRRSAVNFSILLVVCLALAVSAGSQSASQPAAPAGPAPPAFDVVSVKTNNSNCDGNSVSRTIGRFSARCNTLLNLLFNAFPAVKPNVPIPGLPGWATSEHFDVEAKADDETVAVLLKLPQNEGRKQAQAMLQAALVDRFKLRVHTETREGPIYELVVAKGGFKLKNAPADKPSRGYSWGNSMVQVRTGPIASLVFALSDQLGRTVVDKTGLTGNFDIDLKWTPDDQQGTPDAGPTLFTALEEQLGLKLVPARGPVETFVIDHVERPTAN
jgi:uncharacterized protein (TIGR03435 family)